MNNFVVRSLTAIVFAATLMGCILAGTYSFIALFLLISALGANEFYALLKKADYRPQTAYGILLSILVFLAVALLAITNNSAGIYLVLALASMSFFIELYRKEPQPFANVALTLLAPVYVALPFALLLFVANSGGHAGYEYDPYTVLGYFFLVWTSDTCAYLCGKAFGRHPLFQRISPKKTWEGTIGGGLCAVGVAFLISEFFTGLSVVEWVGAAIIIVVAGNLGDLSESMLKRSVEVKDSGNILPGHGGILDRFDAVILSVPLVQGFLFLIRYFA